MTKVTSQRKDEKMKKFFVLLFIVVVSLLSACRPKPEEKTLDFESKNLSVYVGETFTLTPIVTGVEGTDLVTFTIVDPTIISYASGVFSVLKEGSTTIQAKLTSDPTVTCDIQVTAILQEFTITYHLDGGAQSGAPTTFSYASLPVTLPTPTKEGFAFDGWYTTSQLTGSKVTSIPVRTKTNQTFYAKWIAQEGWTITYDLSGGVNPTSAPSFFTEADLPLTLPVPTKADHVFLGWVDPNDLTGTIITVLPVGTDTNQALFALWASGDTEYTIAYTLNEGVLASGSLTSFKANELPVTLPTPTRQGYAFVGWYDNATFEGDYITEINSGSDLVYLNYYARWIPLQTYSITYHLDGGTNNASNITSYNIFDLPFSIEEPTKQGFTFGGWFVNPRHILDPVSFVEHGQNYVLYAKWITETVEAQDVLIDSSLSSAISGTTVGYQGVDFIVGETAFATLQAGFAAATGRVFIVGTFSENVTINKSGLTILGANAFVDPNKATRGTETILKGVITVATNTHDLTFNGLAFTEGARIVGTGANNNIQFMYNYVYDTSAPTAAWIETAGYTSGFFVFSNAANNLLNDFTFLNNKFSGVRDVNINFTRVTNVLVDGNAFTNFERDAIRFDTGGFNQGELTFINNTFVNDILQGYNGIFFRIYGGDEAVPTKILIQGNEFINIGQTSLLNYSGAISMRNFQEKVTTIDIKHNIFENCANYIHIRNNATVANHAANAWQGNVNYNVFYGIPTTYYYRNWTGLDTAATNPETMDFQYNLFFDNDGDPIADLSSYANKFFNVASYANNFATLEAFETAIREQATGRIDVYVNHEWSSKVTDEAFDYEGRTLVFGVSAFASLAEALENAEDGYRIYVLPGTYAQQATVRNNNITILSSNMNIDPNTEIRNPEATITAKIEIVAGVSFLTINGLGFSGSGCVYGLGGISDFTFMYNNYFNTTIGSGDAGLVYLKPDGITGSTSYQHYRLTFMHNRFAATGNPRIINMDRVEDLVVLNNYMETARTDYADGVRVWHLTNTVPVVIEGNTFVNFMQYAIFVSVSNAASQIDIINNTFTNVMRAIDIRGYVGTATAESQDQVNIKYNTFTNATSYVIQVVHTGTAAAGPLGIHVQYNKFMDSIATHYFYNSQAGTAATFDSNYFSEGTTPSSTKFVGTASAPANNFANEADVPVYEIGDVIMPNRVTITNPIASLSIWDEYQINVSVSPSNTTLKRVNYSSSHPGIVSITADGLMTARSLGTAVIRVTSEADSSIFALMTITVAARERIEIGYDGPGALTINDTLALDATVFGNDSETIEWSSSDITIATVDDAGVVTAHAAGNVLITGKVADSTLEASIGLTVYGTEVTDPLLQYLININNGVLLTQEVYYIGSDDGSADYPNRVYSPVSGYLFDSITIIRNMLPTDRANHSKTVMNSVEFISVHDTAGSGTTSTAQANSNWCTNISNTGTSWHYTTGNDGVFQQLENNIKGYHAGDGSREFELIDTGISATTEKPIITINERGFYVLNGIESKILAPVIGQINQSGIYTEVGDNGNYWMNRTYFNTTYRLITNHGGNNNSIGIETAVNNGSDVFFTWQRTAKLIAQLLIEMDLGLDRVLFHNSFSGKPCPRTMMTAGLTEEFNKLVAAEYMILKDYSDYTITFVSHNPSILNNQGRVIAPPLETTNVTYTITVAKGEFSQSITLNALVPGQYSW